MSNDVWVATLISVPVSIGTGLLIEPIRSWMKTKGKTRAAAKEERKRFEYRLVLFHAANPHQLTQYLAVSAVKMAFGVALAVGSLGLSTSLLLNESTHSYGHVSGTFRIMGVVAFAAGLGLATYYIATSLDSLRVYNRVTNLITYLDHVPKKFRDSGLEIEAIERMDRWIPSRSPTD